MNFREAAQLLYDADCAHQMIDSLTAAMPDLTLDDAYEIQRLLVELREDAGEKIIGWKIGLTNTPAQEKFGAIEPVFGRLTSKMYFWKDTPCFTERVTAPKVEPELAFCVKRELAGPGVTPADVYAAVDYVIPAIEIPAGRVRNATLVDMIADNVTACGIVLGGRMTPIQDVDMRLTGVTIEKNGILLGTATTATVCGSPVQAMIWLVNTLARYGQSLKPGNIVMTGSLLPAYPATKGDAFTVSFQGMGSVSVSFA